MKHLPNTARRRAELPGDKTKPAPKVAPKKADDDLTPELVPEEIDTPEMPLGPTARQRKAEDDLVPMLPPEVIDTPDEPITPENAIEGRKQLARMQAQLRALRQMRTRVLEEAFAEIPQEEDLEPVEALARLMAVAKTHGLSQGLIAYADPDGSLKQELGSLESFEAGELYAMEGFIQGVKNVFAKVGDFLTGRMAKIDERDFIKMRSFIEYNITKARTNDGWIKHDCARYGFSEDSLRYQFPYEYYGQMFTAAGCMNIIQLVNNVPGAVRNLCQVPVPKTGAVIETYMNELIATVPTALRQGFGVSITKSGFTRFRGDCPAYAGAKTTRRDPMLFEMGFQSVQTVVQISDRMLDSLQMSLDGLEALRSRVMELNALRDELAAQPGMEADAAMVQRCTTLLYRTGVDLIFDVQIEELDNLSYTIYTILEAAMMSPTWLE